MEDIVENELKLMKCVNHPNIIKLIEDIETDNEIASQLYGITTGNVFVRSRVCVHCCAFVCMCMSIIYNTWTIASSYSYVRTQSVTSVLCIHIVAYQGPRPKNTSTLR